VTDPCPHLTADDVAEILAAVNAGLDAYAGDDLELYITTELIAAGWTAPECDDDALALAGALECGCMPEPKRSQYWAADRFAIHVADEFVRIAVPVES